MSLVDSIINEMDEKKRTLTTTQIRNVKPIVKKTASPMTKSLEKHVNWSEADLEKFGFNFFAGYESFKSSEDKAVAPKPTIIAKHLPCTEADLENFGFDTIDSNGSFNTREVHNKFTIGMLNHVTNIARYALCSWP